MKKKRLVGIVMLFLTLVLVFACGPKSDLDPKKPVTLTLWHNFGGQMQATMDEQVREFNATVGKEKGIICLLYTSYRRPAPTNTPGGSNDRRAGSPTPRRPVSIP